MRTRGMAPHFFGSSLGTLFSRQALSGATKSSASRPITLNDYFIPFPEEPARDDILRLLEAGDQALDNLLHDYPLVSQHIRTLRSKVLFTVNASPDEVIKQGGFVSVGKAYVDKRAPDSIQGALCFAEHPAKALLIHQPNQSPHHQHLYAVAVNRRVITGPEGVIYIPGGLGLSWWRAAKIEKIIQDREGQPVAALGNKEGSNKGPKPTLDQHFEQFCQKEVPLSTHKETEALLKRPGRS